MAYLLYGVLFVCPSVLQCISLKAAISIYMLHMAFLDISGFVHTSPISAVQL